jgi:ribonuclease-3
MSPEEVSSIESRLGYIFLDKGLLIQSLTRKAAAQEQKQKRQWWKKENNYEDQNAFRTLGDAILKAILTELLIQKGYKTPGDITQKKGTLENAGNLSVMLKKMGISPIVGIGERTLGVHEQPYALSETFEAIVAAIYKDRGYETIKELVFQWFSPLI